MAVWEWAQSVYARPGVAEAALTLQDAHGQNVSLLLWAVWAEAKDPALLATGAAAARVWEAAAVGPLRRLRRGLKAATPPVADEAREALRQQVKAVGLQAERVLLETLAGLGAGRGGAPALQALKAASAAWGRPAPDDALAALAAAFD